MRVEARKTTQMLTLKNASDAGSQAGSEKVKDETLVAEALRGSSTAFETLFRRYQQRMFHVALSRLQNTQDAEDAVQQAFQQAFIHLASFQGQSRFSTWLTRIAINESLMLLRKRRPGHISIDGRQNFDDETVTLDIRDRAATPEEQYGERELNNVLTGAINELRPALKTVVKLCEISEVSNTKTANALGVKVGAIKARTFRARRLLREKIAKRLGARAGKTPSALFSRSRASANSTYQAAFSAVAG
ncbi:MAG TPA: sigma-70 family RNA polymerase sigma factor [Candidatus Sulfotelmatobacter sp.]|jgi:RNA polymerase sigma-70 factor (ECF subfamily)|nr:sigma-70 family RNA polymerase sigma factor [Candidatus Sulfotelmatobacter sp.]